MDSDGTTEVLGAGNRGEIWARGPNIMKGYWRNPSATAATLTPDGWLRTGDVAYVDDSGCFFVVDRIKVRALEWTRQDAFLASRGRKGKAC